MKRVIFATVAFCLIDAVLAMTYQIGVRKEDDTDMVQVNCNWKNRRSLGIGESIDFGEIGVGFWDGTNFFMTDGGLRTYDIKISSNEIPVVLDSFLSSQCEVYAPLIGIWGDTQIDNLSVISNKTRKNPLESDVNRDVLLVVRGELSTKFLKAQGSVVIELDGTVNLQEEGRLSLFGYGYSDYLGILGTLTSTGRLNIETTENLFAKIINSGNIRSDTNEISIRTNRFINNETGMIVGGKALFQSDTLIENYGLIDFEEFDVTLPESMASISSLGFNTLRFMQYGTFIVRNQAKLACDLESFGRTYMRYLVFPNISDLKITGGKTRIDRISGRISFIGVKKGAKARIGNLEERVDHVESHGSYSELKIERLVSDKKPVFAPKAGGKIIVGEVIVPESFMYTEDGELDLGKLEGKSLAFAKGTGKLTVSGAADFSLVAEEEAETQVNQSIVRDAYLLGNQKNTFTETTVESLNNHGKLLAIDTNVKSMENDNEISFAGDTLTEKLSNGGIVTFENGNHHVNSYIGRSFDAAIKVQSKKQITDEVITLADLREEEFAVVNSEKLDQVSDEVKELLAFEKNVILQTGSSVVSIDNIAGLGDIEAFRQIYNKKLPTMFHTIGNVAAVLDYMPLPNEIPEHDDGDFLILANMHEDYINSTDINYDDVLIFMQMNGHKWENKYAKFLAGGLKVNNSSSWGNREGFIGLERLLSIEAGMIYNVSSPIARDNGRWVDDWSNWRARLVYYCPATYYSARSNTGIAVIDGDIKLESASDIVNRFSNIYASENLEASANGKFENTVGSVITKGRGKSKIKAMEIINACLSAVLRKGEAHAKGRCGWGLGRHTWYADSYTAEWITQSHGSKMVFGGDLDLEGHTENFGSEIMSRGVFQGNVNSKSLFENIAKHGSRGTAIEEDFSNHEASLLFVHVDNEESLY